MSIPKNINREHIIKAIQKIDREGVPEKRKSTRYNLYYEDKYYPPKYLVCVANIFANGKEYSPSNFSGGNETNRFLKDLGFSIVENGLEREITKQNRIKSLKSYSWEIVSENVVIKTLDKSSFLHNGTGIPKDIRSFFDAENMKAGQRKEISLQYKNNAYKAYLEVDKHLRTRVFWKVDFSNVLRGRFSHTYLHYLNSENKHLVHVCKLKITKTKDSLSPYFVELNWSIDSKVKVEDLETEEIEWDGHRTDGKVVNYYGKRYERDPINRKRAIEIHGLSCVACGFNFEEVYGEQGKDFIEVHHIKPLNTLKEAVKIDPQTDLVPLCANCHRMVHRKIENVLSVEELKELIMKHRE